MKRATRQLITHFLADRGMNPQEIADELGVSRETVRRDLLNPPPPAAPEPAPAVARGAQGLNLPASLQLGKDLRLLAASYKATAEDVARELLHEEAERIRAHVHARWAANAAV